MSRPDEIVETAAGVEQPVADPREPVGALNNLTAPLLMDVKLPIRVLMGRTQLCLRDIAQLAGGSVVELDCSPNDAVEIVVVAGNYGVRITQIAGPGESAQDQTRNDLQSLSEKLK